MEQKLNSNSSAGTAADSDMQPIVIPSADIAVNPMLADSLPTSMAIYWQANTLKAKEFDNWWKSKVSNVRIT